MPGDAARSGTSVSIDSTGDSSDDSLEGFEVASRSTSGTVYRREASSGRRSDVGCEGVAGRSIGDARSTSSDSAAAGADGSGSRGSGADAIRIGSGRGRDRLISMRDRSFGELSARGSIGVGTGRQPAAIHPHARTTPRIVREERRHRRHRRHPFMANPS